MSKIENHKYTIEEAFRDCFYVVPDYQREYVWTEREVNQLLDDISEPVGGPADSDYFIGTIIVSPTGEKNHYEVIDGQQRLTTFFLLLCALRLKFAGLPQESAIRNLVLTTYTTHMGESVQSLKLEPRYENAGDVIQALVAAEGGPSEVRVAVTAAGIPPFGSLEHLLEAYRIIWEYLDNNYGEPEKLKRFWGFLANHVVFIQISTDVGNALKIFETINERGVGLNPMDLLKNVLFTQVQPKDFKRLKDEWKKITKPLEKAKEKPLRFLRYYLMANYVIQDPDARDEKERSEPILREDQIYDWITKPVHAAKCGYKTDPFGFVRRLAQAAELYTGFAKDKDNHGEYGWQMDNLRRLSGNAFAMHSILLLAAGPLPRPLFLKLVSQLEKFMFVHFFTASPAKELERSFSIWADEIRQIAEMLAGVEQADALDEFVNRRFGTTMENKWDSVEFALRQYNLGSMQKYRSQYLLAKLTQYVDMAFQGTSEPGYLSDYLKLQIEHILPNQPREDLLVAFGEAHPEADYHRTKSRLGNLTLLEQPINGAIGNDYFAEKRPAYAKSGKYLTRSIAGLVDVGVNTGITRLNQKVRSFESWDVEAIDERQEMLVKLAADIWRKL